jgi:hypothetical protein
MSNPNPTPPPEHSRFKPGQSGNPKGLPKGYVHSSTRLRRLLDLTENLKNPVTGELEGFTVLEQLDMQQIIKARKGDLQAYKEIMDRLEGKSAQSVDITTLGKQLPTPIYSGMSSITDDEEDKKKVDDEEDKAE